jgi:hypothetical protein
LEEEKRQFMLKKIKAKPQHFSAIAKVFLIEAQEIII